MLWSVRLRYDEHKGKGNPPVEDEILDPFVRFPSLIFYYIGNKKKWQSVSEYSSFKTKDVMSNH